MSVEQDDIVIMRLAEVLEFLKISKSTVYDKLNKKSPRYDAEFPKPIKLGVGSNQVAWIKRELERWIMAQIQRRSEVNHEAES